MGIVVHHVCSSCGLSDTGTGTAMQVGIQVADSVVGMSYSFAVTGINSGTVLSGSAVQTGFAPVQHLPSFH